MNKRGDIRTVEIDEGIVKFDADMPVKHLQSLFGAAETNDLGQIISGLCGFVVEWPFEGDPKDPEAWGELRRSEFGDITAGVVKNLGDSGEE